MSRATGGAGSPGRRDMTTTNTIEQRAADRAGVYRDSKAAVKGSRTNELAAVSRLSSLRAGATINKEGSGPVAPKGPKAEKTVTSQSVPPEPATA